MQPYTALYNSIYSIFSLLGLVALACVADTFFYFLFNSVFPDTMSGQAKVPQDKKKVAADLDRSKIVEVEGEYGIQCSEKFVTLTNFKLCCEGIVEEQGEVTGFMI